MTRAPLRVSAERVKELESAVVTRWYESLTAIRIVKLFARQEHEFDRFSGAAHAAMRERMTVTRQESFFSFLVSGITAAGTALVLALGGVHLQHDVSFSASPEETIALVGPARAFLKDALSTVRDADRILVLDRGPIAASGRHAELIESSPLYRRLCAEFSRSERRVESTEAALANA
jgi:ABC-type multidrug transport system fused ATPase/permease subunit